MSIHDRIGTDLGTRSGRSVLEAVEWAADNDVSYLDVRIDDRLAEGFDDAEAEAVRRTCTEEGVHLGLHNESAVNMAETAPFVTEATERYLFEYVDAAEKLGAEWIVVHGGFQFDDYEERVEAAIDLLDRADARAGDIDLLLENHNPEPETGEIQYMPVTIEECHRFFDALDVGWAFTVNHAHMRPAGIEGFIDELLVDRCGQVRLADNRGEIEEHLFPGEGTIDFEMLFDRLETEGFDGHYMLALGNEEEKLRARQYLADLVDG